MATMIQLKKSQWILNALENVPRSTQKLIRALYHLKKTAQSRLDWDLRGQLENNAKLKAILGKEGNFEDMAYAINPDDRETLKEAMTSTIASLKEHIARLGTAENLKSSTVEDNIKKLCRELKFDALDETLILFYADIENMDDIIELVRDDYSGGDEYYATVAGILGCEEDEIKQKLEEGSSLRAAEIISFNPSDRYSADTAFARTASNSYKVDPSLMTQLKSPAATGQEIVQRLVGKKLVPNLTMDDYAHVSGFEHWADTVAGSILYSDGVGKAFLEYGEPGTGKTESMAVVANRAGVDAYLIGVNLTDLNKDGKSDSATLALRELKRANYFLKHLGIPALLVMDDAEYVFRDTNSKDNPKKDGKAEINDILDNLTMPLAVITNDLSQFDSAYISRMAPPLYVPKATLETNRRIIKNKLLRQFGQAAIPSDETLEMLANAASNLSPREIDRSVKAVAYKQERHLNPGQIVPDLKTNFELIKKARYGTLPAPPIQKQEIDPTLWNMTCDQIAPLEMVEKISAVLKEGGNVRGCVIHVNGPTGTGRRTFSEQAAKQWGLNVKTVPFSNFIDSMTQSYTDGACGAFLDDAGRDRSAIIVTGANDIMNTADPEHHPFFRRILNYDGPVFLVTDGPVKIPKQETEHDKVTGYDGEDRQIHPMQDELGHAKIMAAEIMKSMTDGMMEAMKASGLVPDEKSGALQGEKMVVATIRFSPYFSAAEKNQAFRAVFRQHPPEQIADFQWLTLSDMVTARSRVRRTPWLSQNPSSDQALNLLIDAAGGRYTPGKKSTLQATSGPIWNAGDTKLPAPKIFH